MRITPEILEASVNALGCSTNHAIQDKREARKKAMDKEGL